MTNKLPKPIGQRVLIEPIPVPDRVGSIFIPEAAKEKTLEGYISQLGTGHRMSNGQRKPFAVQVGAKVMFAKFGATSIMVGEKQYLLVHEDDLMGELL